MRDIFKDDDLLLFSPGTSKLQSEGPLLFWLNLTGFNGSCWQSYGPTAPYQSFDTSDIFFFWNGKES